MCNTSLVKTILILLSYDLELPGEYKMCKCGSIIAQIHSVKIPEKTSYTCARCGSGTQIANPAAKTAVMPQ
jgi:DNA-directed RNA polymerase subunit RPC12/RpoP